jgi:hypothetical protein
MSTAKPRKWLVCPRCVGGNGGVESTCIGQIKLPDRLLGPDPNTHTCTACGYEWRETQRSRSMP